MPCRFNTNSVLFAYHFISQNSRKNSRKNNINLKPTTPLCDDNPLRVALRHHYLSDESECVAHLLATLTISGEQQQLIDQIARQLVQSIRADPHGHGGLDAFLQEYKLSGEEGVALMCLAEALLRIPDSPTADAFIEDTLAGADWRAHLSNSESFFVNVSTWGLMLTGQVIAMNLPATQNIGEYLARLVARSGEPLIRAALIRAMKIMGRQFVLAEDIQTALKTARRKERQGYTYSYDMLGEAAHTAADAQKYLTAYAQAIAAIGANTANRDSGNTHRNPHRNAGLSVKLSALHPRYEFAQSERVMRELLPAIKSLCMAARAVGISLTIDAEESERLDPSLSVLESLSLDADLKGWDGLGFVVQSYQKRALFVLDWIQDLAQRSHRKIMIRLVKGAYWDSEIKHAQLHGFADYPVFTRKAATDVSYLACARKLLAHPTQFFPMFATHNAHTVAAILVFAGESSDFEFQCLHGMGEVLYDQVRRRHGAACRIYAPVGPHRELLAYLVRRLLENGANSSFVNRLVDKHLPIEQIVRDPLAVLSRCQPRPHPNIPLPAHLYRDLPGARINSTGINLFDSETLRQYYRAVPNLRAQSWSACPITLRSCTLAGQGERQGDAEGGRQNNAVINPANGQKIGVVRYANSDDIEDAITSATAAAAHWDKQGGNARADILQAAADLYQQHRDEFLFLCNLESGKTLPDAVAELREAVDFLRYYAQLARQDFAGAHALPGPTGEHNEMTLHGRGVFACICPWNFPLAIFTGQISAALAAGNCVIAKPAEQTPLIAAHAIALLHRAGVPKTVLHCLPGGPSVGVQLIADRRIDGVAFTGSSATAKRIQQALADNPGAIRPLIAETGGINAMIVDSTALPEQVVGDVMVSAFQSAGQRCSALRILYLQSEVATRISEMLHGAMAELQIGDPMRINTDIGPIIDAAARDKLRAHVEACRKKGFKIVTGIGGVSGDNDGIRNDAGKRTGGFFFPPTIIEINGIADLDEEVFGPVLHIARYERADLDKVVDDINAAGYGLTFGIHSRIEATVKRVAARIKVGNIYVNRNTIGAVVGVQPFGGERLSGTGPKAGGAHYLHGFALERTISIDTTAAGGNASLLSLESPEST